MKILLFSNGNPFFDAGGYNLQCRYLIQMMKQFKQQGWIGEYFGAFTSIPNLNYEKNPTPKLASQLIQSQGYTPRDPTVFQGMKFLMDFAGSQSSIQKINKVLCKYNIDIFICLCDLMKFSVPDAKNASPQTIEFERFYCPSYCWWPCHYNPIDEYSKNVLQYFDGVITLCPSMIPIIKDTLPQLHIKYIPHVIDYPEISSSETEKQQLRDKLGLPSDKWICLINAMNYEVSCRKSFDTTLMAFQKFYLQHPDKVFLMIHSSSSNANEPIKISFEIPNDFNIGDMIYVTIPNTEKKVAVQTKKGTHIPGGKYQIEYKSKIGVSKEAFSLSKLCQLLEIPSSAYSINQNILSQSELASLYQLSDVLLAPSRSEGFGIPILEAQSIGTPVITTKFLAMEDFTINGISVEPAQDSLNHYQMALWKMPSVQGVTDALETIFSWTDSHREKISKLGRYYIKEEMSYLSVAKKFKLLFESITLTKRRQLPWLQFIHSNKVCHTLENHTLYPSVEAKESKEIYDDGFRQMLLPLFATRNISSIFLFHESQIDCLCHILLLTNTIQRVFIHQKTSPEQNQMSVLMRYPKLRYFADVEYQFVDFETTVIESKNVSQGLVIGQKLDDIPTKAMDYISTEEHIPMLLRSSLLSKQINNLKLFLINKHFSIATFQKPEKSQIDHHFIIYNKASFATPPKNDDTKTWIENLDGAKLEMRDNWVQELTLGKTISPTFSTQTPYASSLIIEVMVHRSIWKLISEHPEWKYVAVYYQDAERLFSFVEKMPENIQDGFCWLGEKHLGHGYLMHRNVATQLIQDSQPIRRELLPLIHDSLTEKGQPQMIQPFLDESSPTKTNSTSLSDSAVLFWYGKAPHTLDLNQQHQSIKGWTQYCANSKIDLHIRSIHDREPIERFQHLVQMICDLLLKYSRVITVSNHNIVISNVKGEEHGDNSHKDSSTFDGISMAKKEYQSYKTIYCREDFPILFQKDSLNDIQTHRGSIEATEKENLSQLLTKLVNLFPSEHVAKLNNTHIWGGYLGPTLSDRDAQQFIHPNDNLATIPSTSSGYLSQLLNSFAQWHTPSNFNNKKIEWDGQRLHLQPHLAKKEKQEKQDESFSWTPLDSNSIYCWLNGKEPEEICLHPPEEGYDTLEHYQVIQNETRVAILTLVEQGIVVSDIYLGLKSKMDYCLARGYDHLVVSKIPDKTKLSKYTYVMYSDPRVMIMNSRVNLEQLAQNVLPEDSSACIAVSNILKDRPFGNVIFRVNDWLLSYLNLGIIGIRNANLFINRFKSDSKTGEKSLRSKVKVIQSLRTLDSLYYHADNPQENMYHLGDFCVNFKGLEQGIRHWMHWMEHVAYQYNRSLASNKKTIQTEKKYFYGNSPIQFSTNELRTGTIEIGKQTVSIEWYSDIEENRFFILPNDSDELFIPKPRNLFTRCESSAVEEPNLSFSIKKPDYHGSVSEDDSEVGDGDAAREVCL
jgi:glycosyltransferase involved in cell wall biosynthesis